MTTRSLLLRCSAIFFLLALGISPALAQGGFELAGADALKKAIPADFYLEGQHIPVQARNAAMVKTGKTGRVLVALLDTSGYSSQVQEKYAGMLITETKLTVCSLPVGIGSYGFGLNRPAATSSAAAKFTLYNQAGERLGQCSVPKDDSIQQPKPLAVTTKGGAATLDLGKYAVEIK